MYLNQDQRNAFFTFIRILFQITSMYLLTSLVSRTYNLTYMERVNGGIISKLKYLLMTRFPTKKHVYGRLMVLIALIVSMLLTGVPTLLGKIYRLHTLYIPNNNYQHSLQPQALQLARVQLGQTDIPTLVNLFGIPSDNATFYNFSIAPPLTATTCRHSNEIDDYYGGIVMTCFGETKIDIGITSPNRSVMTYDPMAHIQNDSLLIPHIDMDYYYFNMSINTPSISIIYDNISPVNLPDADETMSDFRSVESCGANYVSNGRQCVRNTLGYVVVKGKGVLIVKKKLIYQLATGDLIGNGRNCTTIVTKTLRQMCLLTINVENQASDNIIGYQSLTKTSQGIRWDILWRAVDIRGYRMFAVSLDISINAYSGVPNLTSLVDCKASPTCAMSQEVFEATNIYPSYNYQDNHSWADWDFSQQAIDNMTGILLQGSFLFNGATILTAGELLAYIPNLDLFVLTGVIVLTALVGYLASRGVEPTMNHQFSEIFAAMAAVKSPKTSHFWNRKNVVNMTLKRPLPHQSDSLENNVPPEIMVDCLYLVADNDAIRLLDLRVSG